MNIALFSSKFPPMWRIRLERLLDKLGGHRIRRLQNCPRVTSEFLYRDAMHDAGGDESGNGGVIFDVGAHLGETSLSLALDFPNSQIHAFEPVEAVFKQLINHCRKYKNIQCHQLALGATNETRLIQLQSSDPLCSMNQMSNLASDQTPPELKETIQITTIDQIASKLNIKEIALLKIDVEGFELEVLQGSMQMLRSKKIHNIMAEATFNRFSKQHVSIDSLSIFLSEVGYELVGYYDPAYDSHTGNLYYMNALFRLQKTSIEN